MLYGDCMVFDVIFSSYGEYFKYPMLVQICKWQARIQVYIMTLNYVNKTSIYLSTYVMQIMRVEQHGLLGLYKKNVALQKSIWLRAIVQTLYGVGLCFCHCCYMYSSNL